jgi:hypothetical protein
MSKLYVAFGSNLSKAQMRRRCPTARPLGKFMLTSARLVFRSVADLDFVPNESTPCGLWSLNEDDEHSLDAYEGIAHGSYFKSEEIKLTYAGRRRKALIYLKTTEGIYPPSREYARIIRQGYRDFGLDESYLDAAIARAYNEKNPDEDIIARRERQRSGTLHRELASMPQAYFDSFNK